MLIRDLVDLGVASLADLAASGVVAVEDFLVGLGVPVDGIGGLIDSGLATAAELASVGLPIAGGVSVADLVDSGIVRLEELIQAGLVTVDDLVPGATTTLGQVFTAIEDGVQALLDTAIIDLDDLLVNATVDLAELVGSGLVSLAELAAAGILDATGLDLSDIDPRRLITELSFGAPTRWYLNIDDHGADGFDGFGPPNDLESRITTSVAAGDVDGDGDLDIVTGNVLSAVRVHLGNGAGVFTSANVGSQNGIVTDVALADVNGDGSLDILVGRLFATNQVHLNNDDGSGTFGVALDLGIEAESTTTIAAGDLDGDGKLDVAVGNALPGLGVAGAGSYVTLHDRAQAAILPGSVVRTPAAVLVSANGNTDATTFAGATAATPNLPAIGVSAAGLDMNRLVKAGIEGATVERPAGGTTPPVITVEANGTDTLGASSHGGADTNSGGLVASAVLVLVRDLTEAFVSGAVLDGRTVLVEATRVSTSDSDAGATSNSASANAAGVAADVHYRDRVVRARIDGGSVVTATEDITIRSNSDDTATSAAAGTAGSDVDVAIAGSVALLAYATYTRAFVANATLSTPRNVVVNAVSTADITTDVGADETQVTAVQGGIGVSASIILHNDDASAWIGEGADVRALGTGGTTQVADWNPATNALTTTDIRGVAVVAVSDETISANSSTSGRSAERGIAASLNATVLNETTRAHIDRGALVEKFSDGEIPHADQIVYVLAVDWTNITGKSGADSSSGGSGGGVGAGVDVSVIAKTTEAFVSGEVGATDVGDTPSNKYVLINAFAHEQVTSEGNSDTEAGSGDIFDGDPLFVSGAISAALLGATTRAYVGARGDVRTQGTIVINAHHDSEFDMDAGSKMDADSDSVGAAVALVTTANITEAYVGEAATVIAAGLHSFLAPTGALEIVADPNDTDAEAFDVSGLSDEIGNGLDNPVVNQANGIYGSYDLSEQDADLGIIIDVLLSPVDIPDTDWSRDRHARPVYATFRGVSITATNADDIDVDAVGKNWTDTSIAIEASVGGVVTANQTRAYIGEDALVTAANLAAPEVDQDVRVAAGNDVFFYGNAGSIVGVGAALVGVGAGIHAALVRNLTEAYIDSGAEVTARDDVTVRAAQTERILATATGFAGSIVSALPVVSGSIPLASVDNATRAFINTEAVVVAGGNVVVTATDDTDIDTFAAAGALSLGLGTVGASIGIVMVTKDTRAWIGGKVDAFANGDGNTVQAFSGNVDNDDNLETIAVKGVIVQALGTENIFGFALTPSAIGIGLLIAGTVNYIFTDSNTWAFIDDGAEINTIATSTNPDTNAEQSVTVGAGNDIQVYGLSLSITISGVSLSDRRRGHGLGQQRHAGGHRTRCGGQLRDRHLRQRRVEHRHRLVRRHHRIHRCRPQLLHLDVVHRYPNRRQFRHEERRRRARRRDCRDRRHPRREARRPRPEGRCRQRLQAGLRHRHTAGHRVRPRRHAPHLRSRGPGPGRRRLQHHRPRGGPRPQDRRRRPLRRQDADLAPDRRSQPRQRHPRGPDRQGRDHRPVADRRRPAHDRQRAG